MIPISSPKTNLIENMVTTPNILQTEQEQNEEQQFINFTMNSHKNTSRLHENQSKPKPNGRKLFSSEVEVVKQLLGRENNSSIFNSIIPATNVSANLQSIETNKKVSFKDAQSVSLEKEKLTKMNKFTLRQQKSNSQSMKKQIGNKMKELMLSKRIIPNKLSKSEWLNKKQHPSDSFSVEEEKVKSGLENWISLKSKIDCFKYLINRLEMSSMITNFSKFTFKHKGIIKDNGSDCLDIQQENKQQSLLDDIINIENVLTKASIYLLVIFKYFPTFNSFMLPVALFKILLASQLLYQIFDLPLMVAFPESNLNLFSDSHPLMRIMFIIPFILEILLNFNMSFFEHGELVTNKLLIISQYIKNDFWWDLTGLIGTAIVKNYSSYVFILLIFFLRLTKFMLMYETIEEKFQLSLRFAVPYTLFNLFMSITLVAHVCGCLFTSISMQAQKNGTKTWLESQNLLDSSIFDKYVAALYFSFITMISVGYGDITPSSKEERIFVIFMTIFSCGVFAYVVSSIGELFENLQIKQAEYKQLKYEISNYMETRNIDNDLQTKVFQSLETIRNKKQQEPEKGQNILMTVNPKLRESIYENYYGKHLQNWKLLSSSFSSAFLNKLSVFCKEQIYGPGEIIYYQQESNSELQDEGPKKFRSENQNIYFIVKGKVKLYEESMAAERNCFSNHSTLFSEGEFFGTKEFFCGIPYELTSESIGLTSLIKIERSTFIDTLSHFQKDFVNINSSYDLNKTFIFYCEIQEKFIYIRDQLIFDDEFKYDKCQPCGKSGHSMYQCPRMHFLKRKMKSIKAVISSKPQLRQKVQRNRMSKIHAVSGSQDEIRKSLKNFRVDLIYDLKVKEINNEIGIENMDQFLKKSEKPFNKEISIKKLSINSSNSESESDSESDQPLKNQISFTSEEVTQKIKKLKKQFKKDIDELRESVEEGDDEMFFFKCPILIWVEEFKQYDIFPELEEDCYNEAIRQYLEGHFNLHHFNNNNQLTIPQNIDFSYIFQKEQVKPNIIELPTKKSDNEDLKEEDENQEESLYLEDQQQEEENDDGEEEEEEEEDEEEEENDDREKEEEDYCQKQSHNKNKRNGKMNPVKQEGNIFKDKYLKKKKIFNKQKQGFEEIMKKYQPTLFDNKNSFLDASSVSLSFEQEKEHENKIHQNKIDKTQQQNIFIYPNIMLKESEKNGKTFEIFKHLDKNGSNDPSSKVRLPEKQQTHHIQGISPNFKKQERRNTSWNPDEFLIKGKNQNEVQLKLLKEYLPNRFQQNGSQQKQESESDKQPQKLIPISAIEKRKHSFSALNMKQISLNPELEKQFDKVHTPSLTQGTEQRIKRQIQNSKKRLMSNIISKSSPKKAQYFKKHFTQIDQIEEVQSDLLSKNDNVDAINSHTVPQSKYQMKPEDIALMYAFEESQIFTKYYPRFNKPSVIQRYIQVQDKILFKKLNNKLFTTSKKIVRKNLFKESKSQSGSF